MAPARVESEEDAFHCTLTIRIPFPTHRLANVALRALSVDAELSPLVQRSFSLSSESGSGARATVNGNQTQSSQEPQLLGKDDGAAIEQNTILVTHYAATTNRMLRVAVNGFFESVGVVIACMRELDVEVVKEDWVGEGNVEVDELRRVQGLQETGTIG